MAVRSVRYDCTANDNHFIVYLVDGKLEELHFGYSLTHGWVVIDVSDLRAGLKKAGYKLTRERAIEQP